MKVTVLDKKPSNIFGETLFSIFVPGRVNLIGDHTDYNGGLVLPCAIDNGLRFIAKKENSLTPELVVTSASEKEAISFNLTEIFSNVLLSDESENKWPLYVVGAWEIFCQLSKPKETEGKIRLHIEDSLPRGAGLSSSAALCVGLLHSFCRIFGVNLNTFVLAKAAMQIEHKYIGTKCGLMDQICIIESKKNHFLMINFSKISEDRVSTTHVPIHDNFGSYSIAIFNTMVKHSLAESAYNKRREESSKALSIISLYPEIAQILASHSPYNPIPVEALSVLDNSELLAKRATHVLSENERVKKAARALMSGDIGALHSVMKESHESLSTFYEVSCKELDIACKASRDFALSKEKETPLIIGPRMTGGGFGGSTIQLLHHSFLEEWYSYFRNSDNEYTKLTGLHPEIIVTSPQNGLYYTSTTNW